MGRKSSWRRKRRQKSEEEVERRIRKPWAGMRRRWRKRMRNRRWQRTGWQ